MSPPSVIHRVIVILCVFTHCICFTFLFLMFDFFMNLYKEILIPSFLSLDHHLVSQKSILMLGLLLLFMFIISYLKSIKFSYKITLIIGLLLFDLLFIMICMHILLIPLFRITWSLEI